MYEAGTCAVVAVEGGYEADLEDCVLRLMMSD